MITRSRESKTKIIIMKDKFVKKKQKSQRDDILERKRTEFSEKKSKFIHNKIQIISDIKENP